MIIFLLKMDLKQLVDFLFLGSFILLSFSYATNFYASGKCQSFLLSDNDCVERMKQWLKFTSYFSIFTILTSVFLSLFVLRCVKTAGITIKNLNAFVQLMKIFNCSGKNDKCEFKMSFETKDDPRKVEGLCFSEIKNTFPCRKE